MFQKSLHLSDPAPLNLGRKDMMHPVFSWRSIGMGQREAVLQKQRYLELNGSVTLKLAAALISHSRAADDCNPDKPRISCEGETRLECEDNGCCWSTDNKLEPQCFFQTPTYVVNSISNTSTGKKVVIEIKGGGGEQDKPGSPITPLMVEIFNLTNYKLNIRISDPNKQRWQIPESVLPTPPPPSKPVTYANYDIQLPAVGEEFFFAIYTSYYNVTVFNTSSTGLFYGNQFLKIGTSLPLGYNIYGLGEHKSSLKLRAGQTYTLWNYDTPTPKDLNLYGSHPFYMEVRDGVAYGVFLKNSNGMDVELEDQSLIYRINGGILDFYFFVDSYSSPDNIIQQYQEVIGRPAMPPYWALGFHQCRWGYKNIQEVRDVVTNFESNKIPLDTMWTDIDYMDRFRDFTTDPINFPPSEMKKLISDIHADGKHFVVILDPAISNTKGYKPFDDGVARNIFIKDQSNNDFVGKVWPGDTVYPDFSSPLTTEYWRIQIANFLEEVPVDGLWIDMNEPSNFCNGKCANSSLAQKNSRHDDSSEFDPVNPPYSINNHGSKEPLNTKTLDMNALHHGGVEYNWHNLYGLTESMATYRALMSVYKGKRPFVLSRSTFSGSGAYAAHWLGDNTASAEDLYYSIPGILNFQMFGIPMVGADICGFGGTTTEELCSRWMELGAFYPFSRNHNIAGSSSQEPYRWESVAAISRKVLGIRYSLLPYYYTLFFMASHDPNDYNFYPSSAVVLKPLFFDFSRDPQVLDIDTQFLVGSALLISPQLKLGDEGKVVRAYLPGGAVWYDWYTQDEVESGKFVDIDTPIDHIPIHIRGGQIIPMQEPGLTTTESRENPYSLLVALSVGNAEGNIYLDDGITYNATEYTYVSYNCNGNAITAYVSGTKYATKAGLPLLMNMTVLGLLSKPSVVALDGRPMKFTFSEGKTFKLMVSDLSINMDTAFTLVWV